MSPRIACLVICSAIFLNLSLAACTPDIPVFTGEADCIPIAGPCTQPGDGNGGPVYNLVVTTSTIGTPPDSIQWYGLDVYPSRSPDGSEGWLTTDIGLDETRTLGVGLETEYAVEISHYGTCVVVEPVKYATPAQEEPLPEVIFHVDCTEP